jgi:hypothetical protein
MHFNTQYYPRNVFPVNLPVEVEINACQAQPSVTEYTNVTTIRMKILIFAVRIYTLMIVKIRDSTDGSCLTSRRPTGRPSLENLSLRPEYQAR